MHSHDYDNDGNPGFHYYESNSTALIIHNITGSARSRIIQCLTTSKAGLFFDEDLAELQDTDDDRPARDEHGAPPRAETPAAPSADGDRLSHIPEGDDDADMILEERGA